MISSSVLNSIPFKNLDGSYPNMWNTLHENRRNGAFSIIPYCQVWNKDHIVYLQFETDVSTDLTLKSYYGITEVESFTNSYITTYGTTNIRYFFNFVVTLDSDYYDKKVFFTVTNGTTTLTSEPIFTRDLTDDIANGRIKYLKYTNLDRNESDLDDKFIDWSALTSTGKYMDMFIEATDVIHKPSDSVEVFEGSQSKVITSANYFTGKVFKTSGIPDYMVDKLGVMTSLDIFLMNGIQYVKDGEITADQFGNSTSFQVSINLTQKNTIGINVDNLGIVQTEENPPSTTLPMYIGLVDNLDPSEADVKLMTEIIEAKSNQDTDYTTTNKRPCFAYPTSYGALVGIWGDRGEEIISGFAITTDNFTVLSQTINYTIYTLIPAVTLDNFSVTYRFT